MGRVNELLEQVRRKEGQTGREMSLPERLTWEEDN